MLNVTLVLAGTLLFGAGPAAQTPPPTQQQQTQPSKQKAEPSKQMGQQVTLTGCLRQTSDDPKLFALVDAKPGRKSGAQAGAGAEKETTGTSGTTGKAGSAARAPFFRLQDPGTPSLKPHVDKRVELMGTVTPAKDEKGADIVSITKEQMIGATTTTIRALDLKPAPLLNVTSVKATGDCPAAKAKQ